jgi:hypothetical protein
VCGQTLRYFESNQRSVKVCVSRYGVRHMPSCFLDVFNETPLNITSTAEKVVSVHAMKEYGDKWSTPRCGHFNPGKEPRFQFNLLKPTGYFTYHQV